LYLRTRAAS